MSWKTDLARLHAMFGYLSQRVGENKLTDDSVRTFVARAVPFNTASGFNRKEDGSAAATAANSVALLPAEWRRLSSPCSKWSSSKVMCRLRPRRSPRGKTFRTTFFVLPLICPPSTIVILAACSVVVSFAVFWFLIAFPWLYRSAVLWLYYQFLGTRRPRESITVSAIFRPFVPCPLSDDLRRPSEKPRCTMLEKWTKSGCGPLMWRRSGVELSSRQTYLLTSFITARGFRIRSERLWRRHSNNSCSSF